MATIITTITIMILCMMAMPIDAGEIQVEYGRLVLNGYKKCFIDVNGVKNTIELNSTIYVYDGVVFGLIKWKCDSEYGSIISEITCKDCGLYCSYNQQFTKCRNNWIIPAIGFMLSLLIVLATVLILTCTCRKRFHTFILTIIKYFLTYSDRKRARLVRRQNKITGIKNPILFKYIHTQSAELNDMIMESRLKIRKELSGDEPIYEEICKKEYGGTTFTTYLENKVINSPHHRRGEQAYLASKLLTTGLALTTLAGPVYTCDKTLFLSSNGKICDGSTCLNINMYSIPILTGSTICFNTINGDKIEMRIKDSKSVTRYHASYHACSFRVDTKTTYECKSPTSNCWNKGTCRLGYVHPDLKLSKADLNYPNGAGCMSNSIGCDTWCWHQVSCTWYTWVMKPILNKCYKVYHKVSEIWQTSLIIKYKGITKHVKLNTNNPRYNLNGFEIEGLKDMPLIINGFSYETIHLRNSILIREGICHEVDSSMPNFPIKNSIGEYQMSIDSQTYTAYTSTLECQMNSCTGNCTYDQPAVERLDDAKYSIIPKGQMFKNGENVVKRQVPITASANLVIGSVDIESLMVTPSYCKLSVEQTFGCIGCDIIPYVILKAYDIKNEGMLEYESNCTWIEPFLSCNPEPYSIKLDQLSDKCMINIRSTNQTLMVSFTYENMAKLSLLKTYYSESIAEMFVSAVSDKVFWGSILGSLNIMALVSVGSVAALKIARLGIAYKTDKDMNTV